MPDDHGPEHEQSFGTFLAQWNKHESVGTDDVLNVFLPLAAQTAKIHSLGKVGPFNGTDVLRISLGHLWYANAEACEPILNWKELKRIETTAKSRISITHNLREESSDDYSGIVNTDIAGEEETQFRQAYYPGYQAFEHKLGHHDPLSDVFVLGLILASISARHDLTDRASLETFVDQRRDLTRHNRRIHPFVAKIIRRMTELDRSKRPRDLAQVVTALEHYREQQADDPIAGSSSRMDVSDRAVARRHIQSRLRNRLFDLTRRNRLLHFRESNASTNLSVGSVPHVLDISNVRPQQIFHLNEDLCRSLSRPIELGRWLRFEDYGFLSASLDKLRLDAQRDVREYGISQLRLVAAFLRWTNLKEAPNERITSPLVLVPVKLRKKKGVKDSVVMEADGSIGEINPALKHHLQQLYNLRLPDAIDLSDLSGIRKLHTDLQGQLAQSAKEVDLSLIEAPRIVVIQRAARRKLEEFRRRRRLLDLATDSSGFIYSYDRHELDPLGIQIFERDVRVSRAPNFGDQLSEEDLADDTLQPPAAGAKGKSTQLSGMFYAIDSGEAAGPFDWEIDLASVTVANLNYRKMTLVRDYTELLGVAWGGHENFDRLFTREAKPQTAKPPPREKVSFEVVPADPSQARAVARASAGESFVIQGPPGSGKSQTITNLVADAVARGKSVLFVCEKRAALDVVYHRLNQAGLSDLCTLIHDSQADKKAFIDEIKVIYERWLETPPASDAKAGRQTLAKSIENTLAELERFGNDISTPAEPGGPAFRELIERQLGYAASLGSTPIAAKGPMPDWIEYQRAEPLAYEISDLLASAGYDRILSRTPFKFLKASLSSNPDPADFAESCLPRIGAALTGMEPFSRVLGEIVPGRVLSWGDIDQAANLVRLLQPLAEADTLGVLDRDTSRARKVAKAWKAIDEREVAFNRARAAALGWDEEVTVANLQDYVSAAAKWEGRFLAFVSGHWRQARRFVQANYRQPTSEVGAPLRLLAERTACKQALAAQVDGFEREFGFPYSPEFMATMHHYWEADAALPAVERDILQYCQDNQRNAAELLKLGRHVQLVNRAKTELNALFEHHHGASIADLVTLLGQLSRDTARIGKFIELLSELDQASQTTATCLRQFDHPVEHLASYVIQAAIEKAYRRNRSLHQFDSARLASVCDSLLKQFVELRRINARLVVESSHSSFQNDVAASNGSMAGMPQSEKDHWRDFRRGRKIVENELQKTRAYKSIRDMFASEAGLVLRRLKPVWLMSPLSVADILPLAESQFDIVVFDEASQIPIEDAVPALYRSRQMVVVGDEMQLPPTQFFAAREADDDEGLDSGMSFLVDSEVDSFLNRASASLPKTLLNWHYRSRHEALIGFCNRAFYQSKLQTVPSVSDLPTGAAMVVTEREHAADHAKARCRSRYPSTIFQMHPTTGRSTRPRPFTSLTC